MAKIYKKYNLREKFVQSLLFTTQVCAEILNIIALKRVYVMYLILYCGILNVCVEKAFAQMPTVQVSLAKYEKLHTVTNFVGKVEALQKVDIKSNVSGKLIKINFIEGNPVQKDQVLFEINPEKYELEVKQNEAALKVSETNLANEEVQLGRSKFLADNKAISQSQYDKQKIQKLQAQASVDQSKITLLASKMKLEQTQIKAPISGRIGRASYTPGNEIGPETGVLAKIVDDTAVKIYFAVTQKELLEGLKRKDDTKTINLSVELPDGTILKDKGLLNFLDVTTDQKTDTVMLGAIVKNTENLLFDGEIVHIIASRDTAEKYILIPHKSVLIDQSGPYCFVVSNDGMISTRRLVTGQDSQSYIVVISGISQGEKVAVASDRLQPGMKINPEIVP